MNNSRQETEYSFDNAYQGAEDMYGKPYKELQDYFRSQLVKGTVLDLGSGQGRDALYLTLIGYEVTAVDSSDIGVKQMLRKAKTRNLQIEGIVADILDVKIHKKYDVVLFDMILHSFEKPEQVQLLKKYSNNLIQNGTMCIVFPDDIETSHFTKILDSLPQKFELKNEIVIKDIPKLGDEKVDFTFVMIVMQLSS